MSVQPKPLTRSILSHQPLKGLYIIYQLISTLFVRVPVWTLLALPGFNRPRASWTVERCLRVNMLRHLFKVAAKTGPLAQDPDHRAITGGKGVNGVWVEAAPHLITGDVKAWADVAGVSSMRIPGYWYHKKGSTFEVSAPAIPGEKVVYALHGGGYTSLSAHPTSLVAGINRGLLKYAKPVQRVFSLEYRLSKGQPYEEQYPFPTALIDAIAGYHHLVNVVGISPADIVLEGDSAGGNLAIALTRYLVEHQSTLPLGIPGALLLSSPWADIGESHNHPNGSPQLFQDSDYIVGMDPGHYSQRAFTGPHGLGAAESNRYISPGSTNRLMEVSFKGFPKTFIVAGGAEMLYDSIQTLNDRMVKDIGEQNVVFYVAKDAMHDYLCVEWHEPERGETLRAVARWIAALG